MSKITSRAADIDIDIVTMNTAVDHMGYLADLLDDVGFPCESPRFKIAAQLPCGITAWKPKILGNGVLKTKETLRATIPISDPVVGLARPPFLSFLHPAPDIRYSYGSVFAAR
jgi:hypothetical protein